MFYRSILNQVILMVYLLMCPFVSPHSYQNKHSSLQVVSKPDISQETKRLLKRYGTLHTMREFIYRATTEENIYLYLHKIITCLAFERKLIKQHFQRISIGTLQRQPTIYTRSGSFLRYYRSTTIDECSDMKGNTNVIHELFYRFMGLVLNTTLINFLVTKRETFKVKRKHFQEFWLGLSEMYMSISGLLTIQKISLLSPVRFNQFTCIQIRFVH